MGISALRLGVMPESLFAGNTTAQALSASTTKTGTVFTARESIAVDRLGFAYNTKTGTSPIYRISLQSVDASGNPSGTILGATAGASATFDPNPFSGGSVVWFILGESADVIAGNKYAIVVEYSSGTVNVSNFMSVSYQLNQIVNSYDMSYAYPLTNTGSWAKSTGGNPLYLYGTSTDTFGLPISGARVAQTFTNTSEMGFKFAIPAPFEGAATFRLRGLDFLSNSAAGDTWTVKLYSGGGASDTTDIDSVSVDTDCFVSPTTAARRQIFFDDTPPVLEFGATYRLGFNNSDTTTHSIGMVPITTATDVRAFRLGDTLCRSSRSGGNWTDTTTSIPLVYQFFLEDITFTSKIGRPVSRSCLIG